MKSRHPKTGDVISFKPTAKSPVRIKKPNPEFHKDAYTEEVGPLPKGKFVVESARMQGGGTGHGPGDVYPDGNYVVARKLHKNGRYNPKGRKLSFWTSGCFTIEVNLKDINFHGKMKRTVNFDA